MDKLDQLFAYRRQGYRSSPINQGRILCQRRYHPDRHVFPDYILTTQVVQFNKPPSCATSL